ncbi:microtubule-associated protein spiral2-like [Stylonychia lemnae]|uniref:Microtubule-associated protein spiral2-like n=1 Tax=Stylonychia lemnae TaxID=5949 RepID=A0A077ZXC3_STYLE|nr:microtubule-associated protein spiral2-like [Stylonychia lemnae]|eukprot:CDW74550.1 microtubule-associated protein spiral2-like [Stylonychia lemnae]
MGVAAEIFQEKLISYLPKIMTFFGKRIKDSDQILHSPISDSIGILSHQLLRNIEDQQTQQEQVAVIFKQVYLSVLQANKIQQLCAAQCLGKVISNVPVALIKGSLGKICTKISEFFQNNAIKCKTQLLEVLIILVNTVGIEIHSHVPTLIQHIATSMENSDFSTRKQAIDLVLNIAKISPQSLRPYRKEINTILNQLRFDKIKPVRESTNEVLNLFKEIPELFYGEEERLREQEQKEKQKLDQQKKQEIKKEIVKRNPKIIQNEDLNGTITINGVVFADNGGGKQSKEDKAPLIIETRDDGKKLTSATQKRREAKINTQKHNKSKNKSILLIPIDDQKEQQKEHESIFKRNQINKDFLKQSGKGGGIEIFAPDSFKDNLSDNVDNNSQRDQPRIVTNLEEMPHGRDTAMKQAGFPQMTTIFPNDQAFDESGRRSDTSQRSIELLRNNNHIRSNNQYMEINEEQDYQDQDREEQYEESMAQNRKVIKPYLGENQSIRDQQFIPKEWQNKCKPFKTLLEMNLEGQDKEFMQWTRKYSMYRCLESARQFIESDIRLNRNRSPESARMSIINNQRQNQGSDWDQINQLILQNKVREAYQIAVQKSDDDLILLKLMGKTGICFKKLLKGEDAKSKQLVEFLVQRIIAILTTKDFVNVLLPWITDLSVIFVDYKDNRGQSDIISQTVVSDLIEVLIALMNDTKSGIDDQQKNEINRIYENLSQAFSITESKAVV